MEGKIILLATDRGDEKHGEISILDNPEKAQRLIETLLEAGYEQDQVRVFRGQEMQLKVTLRPVVSSSRDEEEPEPVAKNDGKPEENSPVEEPQTDGSKPVEGKEPADIQIDSNEPIAEDAVSGTPAVKLSSLFHDR